jgi:chromosomal replication initiation ATPase DnaA
LALRLHPGLRVEYVTLEEFEDQLHAAIASGQADAFKRRYHDVGILLLDDVQLLAGRAETQSEVLRVLNLLQQRGRQIVMAADRSPVEITPVDERLLTRLSGGLIVDLGHPDADTRASILRNACAERQVKFAPGVLEEIARTPWASVREMQGALNRLLAHQGLSGVPLDVADVWQILGTARTPPVATPNEFEAFLSDIASSVERSVNTWRLQLGERIAHWSGQGFRTRVLEAALDAQEAPDVAELEASFAEVAGRLRALEREAIQLDSSYAGLDVFRDPERLAEAESLVAGALVAANPPAGPASGVRLHDFTRCAANQLALQAVGAVIEAPGKRHNPLVLHGPSGVGKSHLAHATGNALVAKCESARVACVSGDAFAHELSSAQAARTVTRWRSRYLGVYALIVDGLDALEGRSALHDDCLDLWMSLQRAGQQIVVTSERPLAAYRALDARLLGWLTSGLVLQVGAPPTIDRVGRTTPVPEGDEAAAPTIDQPLIDPLATEDAEPVDLAPVTAQREALDSFFFDSEKMIVEWPEPDGRLIEEFG